MKSVARHPPTRKYSFVPPANSYQFLILNSPRRTLFRRSSTNGTDSSFSEDVRAVQRSNILVDYNRLCNDIYICDWLFA